MLYEVITFVYNEHFWCSCSFEQASDFSITVIKYWKRDIMFLCKFQIQFGFQMRIV